VSVLDAYRSCEARSYQDLNKLYSLLDKVSDPDLNRVLLEHASHTDAMLSNKFNDFWALIEKTLLPEAKDFETIKNQRAACETERVKYLKEKESVLNELNTYKTVVLPAKDSEVGVWRLVALVALVVAFLTVFMYLGGFDRLFGEKY